MINKVKNQQNPPPKKSRCVDSQGNNLRKFALAIPCKTGKCKATVPMVEGLTENDCLVLEATIRSFVSHTLHGKIVCNFTNFK